MTDRASTFVHMKEAIANNRPPPQRHMFRLLAVTGSFFLITGTAIGMFLESLLDASGSGLERWLMDIHGEDCADGLLVPGPPMNRLSMIVFVSLLLWSFVGVAIVADIFMVGIEVITSTEKLTTVEIDGVKRQYHVTVWNATVANLTLMALGSSAPEILLSIIEITTSGFYAGELGPSTIVGSAAFNLLVISAVCVAAIPTGEGKIIQDQSVFYITGSFSVFAYLWLLIILMVTSPNIIDVWEGALTFAFFPLLVCLAFFADTGKLSEVFKGFGRGSSQEKRHGSIVSVGKGEKIKINELSKDELGKLLANANVDGGGYEMNPKSKAAAKEAVTAQMSSGTHSRAFYRVAATRAYTGGTDMVQTEASIKTKRGELEGGNKADIEPGAKEVIQFCYTGVSVNEAEKYIDLQVEVVGRSPLATVSAQFDTVSGTAMAGEDFEAVTGRIEFTKGQGLQVIRVPIKEDDVVEGNETFKVALSDPSKGARIGPAAVCEVTIQDNDAYGQLAFLSDSVSVKESDKVAVVTVVRHNGLSGKVTCEYETKDETAIAGTDYEATSGLLVFDAGVTQRQIQVPIFDDGAYEKTESLRVIISNVTGGATLETDTDGGADKTICLVHILSDEVRRELIDLVAAELDLNVDSIRMAASTWKEQALLAVAFEGESVFSAAGVGYILALPWKVICAFIPPPRLANGWVCFCVTLGVIGMLTAIIGDLAAHVGCTMGLKPSITAITFVALGTSLPDTFASKAAAVNEPSADNSIGNITGSNSVNVFLGLGLPWATAAIFWSINGSDPAYEAQWRAKYASESWYTPDTKVGFAVPAGDLGFSVAVFTACALICLGTIIVRRAVLGFELGGPEKPKMATAVFFVLLWVTYIVLSSSSA